MINLLPPKIKQELKFARLNSIVVYYLKIVVALIVFLGVAFVSTWNYLNQRIATADNDLAQKQTVINSYKPTVLAAKQFNSRVAAIKTIQGSQAKFSLLLDDIAKFTLKGTAITSISLTGDDTKPVQIMATATSYNQAVSLRDALASSPRISGADLIGIAGSGSAYTVTIIIGFKPGEAR